MDTDLDWQRLCENPIISVCLLKTTDLALGRPVCRITLFNFISENIVWLIIKLSLLHTTITLTGCCGLVAIFQNWEHSRRKVLL